MTNQNLKKDISLETDLIFGLAKWVTSSRLRARTAFYCRRVGEITVQPRLNLVKIISFKI